MTDLEIATRLKRIVLNAGVNPVYHSRAIHDLKRNWPSLYELIKDLKETKRGRERSVQTTEFNK